MSERQTGPVERLQPAGTLLPLVLSFGNPLDVVELSEGSGADRSYTSFVSGFTSGYARTRFVGGQDCVQVYLTPLAVGRILGVPGLALARHVVESADVAARFGHVLSDRLASQPSWQGRFEIVEKMLRDQVATNDEPPGWVAWMWQRITREGGRVKIGDLVRETGWSHRHATAVFTEHVGLSPKAAADVVRFEHATADVGAMCTVDVAMKHGYADQSHMNRCFARHGAESPVQSASSRRPTPFIALGVRPGS